MRRALRQQHGRLVVIDHRDQHRRRAHRLLARHDLEHAIVALIAGFRNDIGIDQAGRHVEVQPRLAPREKLVELIGAASIFFSIGSFKPRPSPASRPPS